MYRLDHLYSLLIDGAIDGAIEADGHNRQGQIAFGLRCLCSRRWVGLLLVSLFAACQPHPSHPIAAVESSFAPKPAPIKRADDQCDKQQRGPFLYRLAGQNGPVHLLGTIHVMVSPTRDLSPVVWETFSASRALVVELDPRDLRSLLGALVRTVNVLGPRLSRQLTKDEWAKLIELSPVPPRILDWLQPWAAAMVIEVSNVDASTSMEVEFLVHAMKSGISIHALETAEDQVAAIERSFSLADLKEAIAEGGIKEEQLSELVESYIAGDLAAFQAAYRDEKDDPRRTEHVLARRNRRWIPTIERALAGRGNVFIAVGAAHLYGEEGLLKLLHAKGHQAKRVALGSTASLRSVEKVQWCLVEPGGAD